MKYKHWMVFGFSQIFCLFSSSVANKIIAMEQNVSILNIHHKIPNPYIHHSIQRRRLQRFRNEFVKLDYIVHCNLCGYFIMENVHERENTELSDSMNMQLWRAYAFAIPPRISAINTSTRFVITTAFNLTNAYVECKKAFRRCSCRIMSDFMWFRNLYSECSHFNRFDCNQSF